MNEMPLQTRPPTDFIEREVRITAPPATVFAYFIDPTMLPRWMGEQATLEPRPRGLFQVRYANGAVARGTFLEVVPPRRVVFTWGWEGEDVLVEPDSSTVEVTLTVDGAVTILRLRHWGLPPAELVSHAEGWDHFLPRLLLAAASG